MNIEKWLAFVSSSTVIAFTPGPTLLLVIYYSIRYKGSGKYVIPAVVIGDISALLVAFLGLEILLKKFPDSLEFFKIVGGIYLIMLGISNLMSKSELFDREISRVIKRGRIFMHVFFITAFNPKSIIFFLAYFPQFIDDIDEELHQLMFMGIVFIIIATFGAILYNILASNLNSAMQSTLGRKYIQFFTGSTLMILGFMTILL